MSDRKERQIKAGVPDLPGVIKKAGGYQFTLEAPVGAQVSLLLYRKGSKEPESEIPVTEEYRTGGVVSFFVPGLSGRSYEYNFKIDGAVIQDPYARKIVGKKKFGGPVDPLDVHQIRCGFWDGREESWSESAHSPIPYEDLILYKVHVRGYTKSPRRKGRNRGTFRGLADQIPYWKELGINAVELMPAYEFWEVPVLALESGKMIRTRQGAGALNYWGYTEGFYFAPKASYAATSNPILEFQELVDRLHEAGIELIMEFFFPKEVNPVKVLNVLHFWKTAYHVDGFHLMGDGVWADLVLRDPMLRRTKLIVPGYNVWEVYPDGAPKLRNAAVSHFEFEQVMRRFLKSDEDQLNRALQLIRENPAAHGVIHYMASQDGFTMMDMVSYDYRHNEGNGENNRDGSSYNYSWNCGVEGPTRRKAVRQLRLQQLRNAFLLLLFSQGTPMIYGGDEFGNSQEGNNNAYCQDNPVGWVDWGAFKKNEKLYQFVKEAIAFRRRHPILHCKEEFQGNDYKSCGFPDISYHGQRAWYCNLETTSRSVGILYCGEYVKEEPAEFLYVAYNFHWEPQEFALPNVPETVRWYLAADTSDMEGSGFLPEGSEILLEERRVFQVKPRRILVLLGKQEAEKDASMAAL